MPATGKIVQVTGPVLDIEFPPDQLPEIYSAIEIATEGSLATGLGGRIIAEVQQHLGNDWVRAVSMSSTDGLRRGMAAVDTGSPITVSLAVTTAATTGSVGRLPWRSTIATSPLRSRTRQPGGCRPIALMMAEPASSSPGCRS